MDLSVFGVGFLCLFDCFKSVRAKYSVFFHLIAYMNILCFPVLPQGCSKKKMPFFFCLNLEGVLPGLHFSSFSSLLCFLFVFVFYIA